jgi:hypothetical protein
VVVVGKWLEGKFELVNCQWGGALDGLVIVPGHFQSRKMA